MSRGNVSVYAQKAIQIEMCHQLVDKLASMSSEALKTFHREGEEFVATLVEGHMSRPA